MQNRPTGRKRLVVCCDGTWSRLDDRYPTNVVKFAASIAPFDHDGHPQLVFYDEGVGTGGSLARNLEKFAGGALGLGLMQNVEDAYRFLVFNHAPGDEIVIVGFSRGAYTACQLVGLVRNCGILRRQDCNRIDRAMALYRRAGKAGDANRRIPASGGHPASEASLIFRLDHCPDMYVCDDELAWRKAQGAGSAGEPQPCRLVISYLGLWDIVRATTDVSPALHDRDLSGMVQAARHAVAIDETRSAFRPVLWRNLAALNEWRPPDGGAPSYYQQAWFPGDHGSVGGGGDVCGLSDAALRWIADGARRAGVAFVEDRPVPLTTIAPDWRAGLENVTRRRFSLSGLWPRSARRIGQGEGGGCDGVHWSTRARWEADARYRPATLMQVEDELEAMWMERPDGEG